MPPKLAVLLVHGIDRHNLDDLDMDAARKQMMQNIQAEFERLLPGTSAQDALTFEIAAWAVQAGLQFLRLDFIQMMTASGVKMGLLREFLLDVIATTAVYQSRQKGRMGYEAIHETIALGIRSLGQQAGVAAPLYVVAHSVGGCIAQQYFYDLQWDSPTRPLIPASVRQLVGVAPIEKGHTLAGLYTLGSPSALWQFGFDRFGTPAIVPAPQMKDYHPRLVGRWLNIYDKDDVLAYPLQPLNAEYDRMVQDVQVNVGGLLESWNPASHLAYWADKAIARLIAADLAAAWQAMPS